MNINDTTQVFILKVADAKALDQYTRQQYADPETIDYDTPRCGFAADQKIFALDEDFTEAHWEGSAEAVRNGLCNGWFVDMDEVYNAYDSAKFPSDPNAIVLLGTYGHVDEPRDVICDDYWVVYLGEFSHRIVGLE